MALAAAAAMKPLHRAPKLDLSVHDFEVVRVLGEGSLSTVFLALWKAKGSQHALKVIDKTYIARHNMTEAVIRERHIMDRLVSDCIVELQFTFQDSQKLYMGMEVCPNGDLYEQIHTRKSLPLEDARAYAAEMVAMLAVLREHSVVFRDFKPENMLLDAQGHLKLTDFGCAKIMDNLRDVPAATPANTDAHDAQHGAEEPEQRRVEGGAAEVGGSDESHAGSASDALAQSAAPASGRRPGVRRTVSFVGTADYLAPETLENTSCSCAVDLWALGCVVYQMLVGKTPFRCVRVCQYDSGRRVEWLPPGKSEYLTMMNISERRFAIPEACDADMADLITQLLRSDPTQRLGYRDLSDLKNHEAFEGVGWDTLRQRSAPEYVTPTGNGDGEADLWEMQALQRTLPPH